MQLQYPLQTELNRAKFELGSFAKQGKGYLFISFFLLQSFPMLIKRGKLEHMGDAAEAMSPGGPIRHWRKTRRASLFREDVHYVPLGLLGMPLAVLVSINFAFHPLKGAQLKALRAWEGGRNSLGRVIKSPLFFVTLYFKTAYFPVYWLLRGPCQIVCVRLNEHIKGLLCSYLNLVFTEFYLHSHEKKQFATISWLFSSVMI